MSETAKVRSYVLPHLVGNGIDVGCGNDPIKPNCIAVDLPPALYMHYNGEGAVSAANLETYATLLPFKDDTMDWVYSSHLLEDFEQNEWPTILSEWIRVLKRGGLLVVVLPEKEAWIAAVAAGQPPNCAHRHEGTVGELTELAPSLGLKPVRDERIADYSLIFAGTKI